MNGGVPWERKWLSGSEFPHSDTCIGGVTNLITSTAQFRSQRRFTTVVFLDIKSAFDSATHDTNPRAFEEVGFSGRLEY